MTQMGEELYGSDIKLYIETKEEYVGPGADLMVSRAGDLQLVSGRENLGQAIMHRLLTRQGELAELGHPRYGSRLHELIGQPNNDAARERVRLYVKECITQERRVREIVSVRVSPHSADMSAVIIDITVVPIRSNVPMNLVFPYYLEVS